MCHLLWDRLRVAMQETMKHAPDNSELCLTRCIQGCIASSIFSASSPDQKTGGDTSLLDHKESRTVCRFGKNTTNKVDSFPLVATIMTSADLDREHFTSIT